MKQFVFITFLVAFLITPNHADRRNPLKDPHFCGRPECESTNDKFHYSTAIKYKYDYQMHVRTEFAGSGENTSDVFVTASVYLSFPRKCEGILSIQEVELREATLPEPDTGDDNDYDFDYGYTSSNTGLHPNSYQFSEDISKNDLRFSFTDGIISEVCPLDDESNWVLNFKKGILSALQNTMKRFDVDHNTTETDVSGTCDVAYTLSGASETSLLIHKTKDLTSCINRYKTKSVLQTTPYDFRKNYAVWPILRSNSVCNFSIDHNVYQEVNCFERHQLVPFSNNQTGAVTESKQKLTLSDEIASDSTSYNNEEISIRVRSPLLFNHAPSPKPTTGEIKASRDLLKQMCKLGFPNIQREFIEVFTNFLQTARLLSYTALEQLLARATSICPNGKNHVLESLPYIGSTASIQLMKDDIIRKAIPLDVAHSWLTSLSYLPRPNADMLQSFYDLIKFGMQQNDPMYLLPTTAVIHTFCRTTPDCDNYSEITNILYDLEIELNELLRKNYTERVTREKITHILKGIGNIGLTTKRLTVTLQRIITNEDLPISIRLEAIYSHRRLDCSSTKDYFLDIYRNFNENSEIRIASYLQAMRCPDYMSIKTIKYVLTNEEVNQVGSFVWSHLKSLAKSASPVHIEAQGLLIEGDLGIKYKMDIRKFSRNFEHSLFFDEYNIGANADSNVIFGTDSYMPRSASFNFTVDLFGESINFFEIATRMEGFEHIVESIFGPKGPLNTQKFMEKFQGVTKYFRDSIGPEESEYLDKLSRMKRDTEEEEDTKESYEFEKEDSDRSQTNVTALDTLSSKENLQKKVEDLNYHLKYNFNQPRAAFGFKIFGNDINYKTIEGLEDITDTMQKLNPMNHLKNLFSGKEITYTKSGVLLDVSYNVPLSCGLPLSIHAFGASSIDLRMSGSLRASFAKEKYFDLAGKLKPSVSVDIIASMQSDYFYGSSGIRVKSNLYSSSAVDAKIKINSTTFASVQFNLPQDRNDIFSARSELLVIKSDKEIKQKGIPKRYSNATCTWPFIDRAIGLKFCADYSLPDVSNSPNSYPSLILSGPIDLNIFLNKADVSAKTFLFEYRWDDFGNSSKGSFVFHTPESAIKRILMANITTEPNMYNLSMSFVNGDRRHSAVGNYKNMENEKKIEIYLNLDGSKNLLLEMELNKTQVRYGWVYYPKCLLSVNNDLIAGLSGKVKVTGKKNVLQYDLNFNFETKRLKTNLAGYIIQTEASVSTKMKLEYMFLDNKVESVEVEGELSNRSQRSRTEFLGSLKLNSSAYQQFSFASNFSFVSLLGHIETKININNAADLIDPNQTLSIRLMFARFHNDDKKLEGYSTEALVEVQRPKSNIDFKFLIRYEEKFRKGLEHNVQIEVKYAPNKKATGVLSILFPRGPLFALDGMVNITVPSFEPCVISLRLMEKASNEYTIDFKGTLFTGHSMAVKGIYQDKSSSVKNYHHLKLAAKSPHFEDTYINLRYWRDEAEISFNLQVDYAKQPYGLLLKYSERQANKRLSFVEFKFRDKIYSVSTNVMSEQPKQLVIEVHLDKIRDIHLLLRSLSTDAKKEMAVEIKWDANRDPTEKLAISAEFNHPRYRTYDGNFLITYPERTFSGNFDIYAGGPEYRGVAHLGWSSYESIQINFNAGTRFAEDKDVWLKVKVNTPFEGWKTNSISGGLYTFKNLLLANGSLSWADNQNLALALLGDYKQQDPVTRCEFKFELNSTVRDVPTATVYFKHHQDNKKIETDIKLKHTPGDENPQKFSVRSVWQFDAPRRNIDGQVVFYSPFVNYTSGSFSTKINIGVDKRLKAAASLDIEKKQFTVSVDGYAKKITDTMFVANITTPIDKFRKIVGRFGISERNKHFVAEIRAPGRALGVELIYVINTIGDFNIKFNLETPLEAFEKVLVVGKFNSEMMEFRGGWNKIILGFVGVWRMVNFTDFEYSYKVFTPLENLIETGFVAKLIKQNKMFDMELTLKFAQWKIGVIANGKPKPEFLRQLNLQSADSLQSVLLDESLLYKQYSEDEEEIEEELEEEFPDEYGEEEELFNFIGNMELDTLVWPTVIGSLDIEERGDNYFAFGTVKVPNGMIEARNILYYPDLLNIKNSLHIDTPFNVLKEVKLIYIHSVQIKKYYIFGMEVSGLSDAKWIQAGACLNYTNTTEEAELRTHDLLVGLMTPLEKLPTIYLKGNIELEDTIYRGNISAKTSETALSLGLSLENDENFIDASFGLSLDTALVPKYSCKFYFKKDLSDVENSLEVGFDIHDNGSFNTLRMESMWHTDYPNYLNCKANIHTNLIPIYLIETSFLLTKSPHPIASASFGYTTVGGKLTEFLYRATRKLDVVTVEIKTPIKEIENVSLHGTLNSKQTPGLFYLLGNVYKNGEVYHVEGVITLKSDIPIDIQLKLKSLSRDTLGFFTYQLKDTEGGYGKTFQMKAIENEKFVQISGGYSIFNKFDWNILMTIQTSDGILTPAPGRSRVDINATVSPSARLENGKIIGFFELLTPWSQLGIDAVKLGTEFQLASTSGDMRASYELARTNGKSSFTWTWIPMENMQILVDNIVMKENSRSRILKAGFRYSKGKTIDVGTVLNVDDVWQLETNCTVLSKSLHEGDVDLSVLLPEPFKDVHKVKSQYKLFDVNLLLKNDQPTDLSFDVKYEGVYSKKKFGSKGFYKNVTDLEGLVHVDWGDNIRLDTVEANVLMQRKGLRREFSARVATPMHIEDTLTFTGFYDVQDIFNLYAGRLYYPSSKQIANGDISFSSFSNMKGNVNCTTPLRNLTWVRADFDFTTNGTNSLRYIKATWPKDSAYFNLQSSFKSVNLDRDLYGTIKMEVPLATRHYANIDYSLNERRELTTGHCIIDYNRKRVLNGKYVCKSESSAGFEKDVVDIKLENDLKPIGINYVHLIEEKGGDAPLYDMKRAEIYELQKSKAFNITAELHVTSSYTGQAYKIVAIHPNRTVIITSDYDFQDRIAIQRSKIQLSPNIWLAYDVKMENLTRLDNESQKFNIELSYPKRNLSTEGWYSVTDTEFNSDVSFKWTYTKAAENSWDNSYETPQPENKMMRASFQWRNEAFNNPEKTNHTALLAIRHPSFQKDITFKGLFYRDLVELFRSNIEVDYCDDPKHLLTLKTSAKDLWSIVNYRNYSIEIFGDHSISELDLNMKGSVAVRPGWYGVLSDARYKRGYLPLQEGTLDGFINLNGNEIYYKKISPHRNFLLWGKTINNFPIYTFNATYEDSPDVNSTGRFYLNLYEKYVRLDVNMTPDASQNLLMLGYIADARNAFFDLYRDYEDIRVVDVSYYLRMNHSRLVTSQLIWRPKMKSEIKAKIKQIVTSTYDSISDNLDFWVKTTYTETVDTISDVWSNAKPYAQVFLDDVGGLRIIEEDLQEFRVFLNQSYEANDFYIKTMVNFTMTILDELAIRNHIHSVPIILNEIWQAFGDSGQAFRQSIIRLIETVKESYRKAVEFIGRIFHGEALDNLSILMEKAVTRYDKFMKDLHLSLIKYVENVWTRITDAVMGYWKKFLQRIEPSIFKIAQYLETVLWNVSKEIFDFLYKRTNEIVASPYFNTVSNFTQDLDRLYTDIVSNDAITNIKKYTDLAIEFLKEEYFKIVPFGKEMHDIITEVIEEIKTLQNLEPIQFVIQRINEIKMKLEWVADEFQLENRLEKLWEILQRKVAKYAQTALEMDDKYREAKTKFIFDPDVGVINLEQKLPMSWHAFNETPKFEEIPEYKLLADIQGMFTVSNYTFWNFYHDVRPYMDLSSWLPPFKASSLLLGSRHFMTFDKRFVALNSRYFILNSQWKPNQCAYLLAHDFVDSNFTLVIKPSITKYDNELVASKNLALATEGKLIDINIVGSAIRIGSGTSATLPMCVGDSIIHREANSLLIDSGKGFNLNCNLEFDVCWFELSGWYFGRTSGLLGNMNNEKYDDIQSPAQIQSVNDFKFVESWALENCTQEMNESENNASLEVISICDGYFKSKISSFVNCFSVVDPAPFYEICLDLGMNSFSNVINDTHPAQKGTCTAAVSYIETCAMEQTPLRIPYTCIHCQLVNGTYVPEGKFVKLTGEDVPKTTDVVFIVEAKPCNKDFVAMKSMMTIVSSLEKEFIKANLTNNRYSVISFGGAPPFDKARSIVYNNEIFTNHIEIKHFFDHIKTSQSNSSDIFEALSMAFKLIYRPGASKTFILLPCSTCSTQSMKLDYSSILQVLLEEGINLHILMDQEFVLDKRRIERVLFGFDRDSAYTKNYLKEQRGDKNLKRQIRLPKSTLGLCAPLALESNGTVFTSRKLRPRTNKPIKKIATVFAKRVAVTAKPARCQLCECTGHNTGTSYMACTHCHFPNPSSLDYGYNEEEMMSIMQTDTDFSWEWNDDEDMI